MRIRVVLYVKWNLLSFIWKLFVQSNIIIMIGGVMDLYSLR